MPFSSTNQRGCHPKYKKIKINTTMINYLNYTYIFMENTINICMPLLYFKYIYLHAHMCVCVCVCVFSQFPVHIFLSCYVIVHLKYTLSYIFKCGNMKLKFSIFNSSCRTTATKNFGSVFKGEYTGY